MVSKNLVICDKEAEYAAAFAKYLMQREELSVQVQICSDLSFVLAMQEKEKIEFLFVSSEYSPELREQVKAELVFVLAEERRVKKNNRELLIYKYQSGDEIFKEMIQYCRKSGAEAGSFLNVSGKSKCRLLSVYSPIHRIGKTAYALKLGRKLARESNVLYLNMELYGGHGGYFSEDAQSLSDLLYYARQEESNLGLILPTLITHMEGFDYIAPVRVSDDLREVTGEEWMILLRRIMEESIYDVLILDLDDGIRGLYSVLQLCQEVHLLTLEEPIAGAKLRQFEEEYMLLGYEELGRKIVRKEPE